MRGRQRPSHYVIALDGTIALISAAASDRLGQRWPGQVRSGTVYSGGQVRGWRWPGSLLWPARLAVERPSGGPSDSE